MNYKKIENFEKKLNMIRVNDAMVAFSAHNIGFL